MSLILGPMRLHIPGRKELTDHTALRVCPVPKKIYIPLIAMGNEKLELYVQPGDKVLKNQKVAARNDHFYIPLFAPVSGTVLEFENIAHLGGPRKVKHLVIENDELYESVSPTPKDFRQLKKEEIVNHIKEMGIVGCGGAGFPTYMKYNSMDSVEFLIINGVECEPYLTSDYLMTKDYLKELVSGVTILQKAANARTVYIAIKKTKAELIKQVKEAIAHLSDVVVKEVPDVYPMGWERTLVYELTKRRYDRLPAEVGCIVNNLTTAIMVARAFELGIPITEKYVTVSGEAVNEPANVKVTVGTPLAQLIETCGGLNCEDIHLIGGGPMMGKVQLSDAVVVGYASNGLTVIPQQQQEAIACLRCGSCSDHCPAGLQPVLIAQAEKNKNADLIMRLDAMSCIECGLCTYVCPSLIDVTENVRRAKRVLQLRK